MASGLSLEILDLRHFAAPALRPLLEAESAVWRERLNWDYLSSAKLLLQYLDARTLPGYVALDAGRVTGYIFCVYEDSKAVIGDVFAHNLGERHQDGHLKPEAVEVETNLLRHMIELLLNSPGVDRIESQLLLHPGGALGDVFREAGFDVHRRLYLRRSLAGPPLPRPPSLPSQLEMRPWQDSDLVAAGRLISEAYRGHTDSLINDQYRTVHGSAFSRTSCAFPAAEPFLRRPRTWLSNGATGSWWDCCLARGSVRNADTLPRFAFTRPFAGWVWAGRCFASPHRNSSARV